MPLTPRIPPSAPQSTDAGRQTHWQRNLRTTGLLLAVWFGVTFGISFFARELNFSFFGWPFSFWVAAQGALVVYVVIIAVYARAMNRLDHQHAVAEDD